MWTRISTSFGWLYEQGMVAADSAKNILINAYQTNKKSVTESAISVTQRLPFVMQKPVEIMTLPLHTSTIDMTSEVARQLPGTKQAFQLNFLGNLKYLLIASTFALNGLMLADENNDGLNLAQFYTVGYGAAVILGVLTLRSSIQTNIDTFMLTQATFKSMALHKKDALAPACDCDDLARSIPIATNLLFFLTDSLIFLPTVKYFFGEYAAFAVAAMIYGRDLLNAVESNKCMDHRQAELKKKNAVAFYLGASLKISVLASSKLLGLDNWFVRDALYNLNYPFYLNAVLAKKIPAENTGRDYFYYNRLIVTKVTLVLFKCLIPYFEGDTSWKTKAIQTLNQALFVPIKNSSPVASDKIKLFSKRYEESFAKLGNTFKQALTIVMDLIEIGEILLWLAIHKSFAALPLEYQFYLQLSMEKTKQSLFAGFQLTKYVLLGPDFLNVRDFVKRPTAQLFLVYNVPIVEVVIKKANDKRGSWLATIAYKVPNWVVPGKYASLKTAVNILMAEQITDGLNQGQTFLNERKNYLELTTDASQTKAHILDENGLNAALNQLNFLDDEEEEKEKHQEIIFEIPAEYFLLEKRQDEVKKSLEETNKVSEEDSGYQTDEDKSNKTTEESIISEIPAEYFLENEPVKALKEPNKISEEEKDHQVDKDQPTEKLVACIKKELIASTPDLLVEQSAQAKAESELEEQNTQAKKEDEPQKPKVQTEGFSFIIHEEYKASEVTPSSRQTKRNSLDDWHSVEKEEIKKRPTRGVVNSIFRKINRMMRTETSMTHQNQKEFKLKRT